MSELVPWGIAAAIATMLAWFVREIIKQELEWRRGKEEWRRAIEKSAAIDAQLDAMLAESDRQMGKLLSKIKTKMEERSRP